MADYPSNTLLLLALFCASAVTMVDSQFHGDICKTLVETHPGYACEKHQVTTKDGFILGLQRVSSKKGSTNTKKQPVILQHGIMMDGAAWLLNSPDKAPAYILADKGYDVWLANARATDSSLGHTSLNPLDPRYWDWSWDEMSGIDLPTYCNYVKSKTGQKSHYVGHSLGTLVVLAALSKHNLLDSIRSAALFAPIAHLGSASTKAVSQTKYDEQLQKSRLLHYPAQGPAPDNLQQSRCGQFGADCSDMFGALGGGPNCCISPSSYSLFGQHTPQPNSIKNSAHLSQMVLTGAVEMFNYDSPGMNMQRYRQLTPPVYNMASIPKTFPLYLAYGGGDTLSVASDVKVLLNDLKGHDRNKLVENYIQEYAHLDFIMADNANAKVYTPLMTFFSRN